MERLVDHDDSEEDEGLTQPLSNTRDLFKGERFRIREKTVSQKVVHWRMRERMKTVSVALTLCLNIGVDPPDVVKTTPCSMLESWIDPHSMPPAKALDAIGKSLQAQYERWQPRAKYKHCLDPTFDDVRKLAQTLRRSAKDERILFHYNGHGVPKPTHNGELWVFNKNYTQYIPLSIYELQGWVGNPSIYVFDCPSAGVIVHWFLKFAEQRDQEEEQKRHARMSSTTPTMPMPRNRNDFILLAATSTNEVLPTNPDLPADLFTACLTTPIVMALSWFSRHTIISGITPEMIEKIPGRHADRRTPLGELNWIFTAITDTIAWNMLPQELFQKLFRQDLLVASLFRNFLLAARVMRTVMCTPISYPKLPATYNHPMWQAWDLAADQCLAQLPQLLNDPDFVYRPSTFFTEQLTAFEVWLQFGSEERDPPEQLPIVLQVLLSQQHRLRALELLARFLDLGSWAVNHALSVGIFPYVLKLLQSPAVELRRVLVFIWGKILALDKSCQLDLVKDNGQSYFVSVLANNNISADQRIQAAFVLSVICNNCRPGQIACLNAKLLQICLLQVNNADPLLRRWAVLCLAKQWENYEEAKNAAIAEQAHVTLCGLLTDPISEVRAAAVFALGTFIGWSPNHGPDEEQRTIIELNLGLTFAVVTADASPLVRRELAIALSHLVTAYSDKFKHIEQSAIAKKLGVSKTDEEVTDESETANDSLDEENGIYEFLWTLVVSLTFDPVASIARTTRAVVHKVRNKAKSSLTPTELPTLQGNAPSVKRRKSPAPSSKFSSGLSGIFRKTPRPSSSSERENSGEVPDPPVSDFYEWSCEYFSLPLVNAQEEDDTDPSFQERKFRLRRNREIIKEAQQYQLFTGPLSKKDKKPAWENEIAILENEKNMVCKCTFHPFENIIMVCDDHDRVSVWDWEAGAKLNSFANRSASGCRITNLSYVNEHDVPLVCVGTDDGVIKIWENTYSSSDLRLVTAWRAINLDRDLLPIVRGGGPGLVADWCKQKDLLVATGNVGILKLWDVTRELSIADVPTQTHSAVTCVKSDRLSGNMLVTGFANGSVSLFDQRSGPSCSLVQTMTEHKGWVIDTFIPDCLDGNKIISGAASGEIKVWDVRNLKSAATSLVGHQHPVVTAVSVHHRTGLIAVGSQDQRVRIMSLSGDEVDLIRYHDGFLGQRIGPVSALNFHRYKPMLAAGATDSIISIYASDGLRKPQ